MEQFDYFGTATNLSITAAVALYGAIAWLRKGPSEDWASHPFKRRAYLCWWLSWLSWVFAWALLLTRAWLSPGSIRSQVIVLILDNLNCTFLILIFLVLSRGDSFGPTQLRLAFAWIVGSVGTCTAIIYSLSHWLNLTFAFGVHRIWSLCLSIVCPILVGWAFNLRFNTLSALAVGFVYGFIQPIVYIAELQLPGISEAVAKLRPVTAMTLAGLKIAWAIIFMQTLSLVVTSGKSLVDDRPTREVHVLTHGWDKRLIGQALMLIVIYTALLIWMFVFYVGTLEKFAVALGIVGGIIGLLDFFWRLWEKASRYFARSTQAQSANAN